MKTNGSRRAHCTAAAVFMDKVRIDRTSVDVWQEVLRNLAHQADYPHPRGRLQRSARKMAVLPPRQKSSALPKASRSSSS